ncbi:MULTISPECIES: hypothetical protein [Nocardia]|uniref:hypothetical protein n=1 Tax=Nocardia TaxID=1817 RepID=UPI0013003CB6|nr:MULTISPECIES: hypothetical protein [Nocardia]
MWREWRAALAEGSATLLECLARAVNAAGVALADAVVAATAVPADGARLSEIGDLWTDGFADLLIVDDNLQLRRVLRRGQWLK